MHRLRWRAHDSGQVLRPAYQHGAKRAVEGEKRLRSSLTAHFLGENYALVKEMYCPLRPRCIGKKGTKVGECRSRSKLTKPFCNRNPSEKLLSSGPTTCFAPAR